MSVIKNLFHISIQADDYEKALEFYCEKLGFEQMFELNVGQFREMLDMSDGKEDKTQWLTYLRIAPEEYLEMFNGAINPPEFQKEKIVRHKDSPLESFALGCDSLEETIQKLKERGVEVTDGYITDPNGARIRLVERKGHEAKADRLFNSLAGVSLYVNSLEKMEKHFRGMGLAAIEKTNGSVKMEIGEFGQYVELLKAPETVATYDDDPLGHIAVQICSVTDTVKAWGKNGLHCCPQPFMRDVKVPADDTAKGNIGLDRCEIIWIICPEGNKVEVMVQPGNTMQQEWERENPF